MLILYGNLKKYLEQTENEYKDQIYRDFQFYQ